MSRILRLSEIIARYHLFRDDDEDVLEDLFWLLWRRRVRLTHGGYGWREEDADRAYRRVQGPWFVEEE